MKPPKRKVTVTVNSALLDEVEHHATHQTLGSASNRSAVFEKALRLLRQWQIDKQIEEFYKNRSQADVELEEEIAAVQQEQLEEI